MDKIKKYIKKTSLSFILYRPHILSFSCEMDGKFLTNYLWHQVIFWSSLFALSSVFYFSHMTLPLYSLLSIASLGLITLPLFSFNRTLPYLKVKNNKRSFLIWSSLLMGGFTSFMILYFWMTLDEDERDKVANIVKKKGRPIPSDGLVTTNIHNLILKDLKKPEVFVSSLFTPSQSLVRFLKERKENRLFLFAFLRTIPLKKSISVDNLKWIIVGTHFYGAPKSIYNILQESYFSEENLNYCFQDYAQEDIKRLLTKYYSMPLWLSILDTALSNKIKLPVNTSVTNLYNQVVKVKHIYHPNLRERTNGYVSGAYKLKFLSNKFEFEQFSDEMGNCVRSYFYNSDTDIIAVYKNEKPYICVEIKNSNICQVRGLKNRIVSDEEHSTIKELIQNS